MNLATRTVNFLATRGEKVIVECGGHVYSVPLEDVRDLPLSEHPPRKSYYPLDSRAPLEDDTELKPKSDFETTAKQVDSFSEVSDSEAESSVGPKEHVPLAVPSSSPSQVLAKLKDEVTRLIDESIQKIEQEWAEKVMGAQAEEPERTPASPGAAVERDEMKASEDAHLPLHPDGDRGQLNYREQNLQVLHSKSFVESKRLTRMKLLDEIHALVDRLKDLETLE